MLKAIEDTLISRNNRMKRISISFYPVLSPIQNTIYYFLFAIKIKPCLLKLLFFRATLFFLQSATLYGHFYSPHLDGQLISQEEMYYMYTGQFKGLPEQRLNVCKALQPYLYWPLRSPSIGMFSSSGPFNSIPHLFSLWDLAPHRGSGVSVALIDTDVAQHKDLSLSFLETHLEVKKNYFSYYSITAHHGTHLAGIMAGKPPWYHSALRLTEPLIGIVGIAPEMTLYGIPILKNDGIGDSENLLQAFAIAQKKRVRIINLSARMKHLICFTPSPFPFLVVPVNSGFFSENSFGKSRYSAVLCEVASFTFDGKGTYKAYSELDEGILLPGTHILSTAIPGKEGYDYLFMSGNSQATAYMTGFFALVLGEFEHLFNDSDLFSLIQATTTESGAFDIIILLFIIK